MFLHAAPLSTSVFTDAEYTRELLSCGHDGRIKVLQMKKSTINILLALTSSRNLLKASKNIAYEEQLLMFLIVLTHGLSNCTIHELFQHSGETVRMLFTLCFI